MVNLAPQKKTRKRARTVSPLPLLLLNNLVTNTSSTRFYLLYVWTPLLFLVVWNRVVGEGKRRLPNKSDMVLPSLYISSTNASIRVSLGHRRGTCCNCSGWKFSNLLRARAAPLRGILEETLFQFWAFLELSYWLTVHCI